MELPLKNGIAGTGRMGAAVAGRLLSVGHDVKVWNRTREKTQALALAGASVAATPAQLAARAEIIITFLTDAAAIDAAYHGGSGLLARFWKRPRSRQSDRARESERVRREFSEGRECQVAKPPGHAGTKQMRAAVHDVNRLAASRFSRVAPSERGGRPFQYPQSSLNGRIRQRCFHFSVLSEVWRKLLAE